MSDLIKQFNALAREYASLDYEDLSAVAEWEKKFKGWLSAWKEWKREHGIED